MLWVARHHLESEHRASQPGSATGEASALGLPAALWGGKAKGCLDWTLKPFPMRLDLLLPQDTMAVQVTLAYHEIKYPIRNQ